MITEKLSKLTCNGNCSYGEVRDAGGTGDIVVVVDSFVASCVCGFEDGCFTAVLGN